ncbi:Phage baseplate assembly protein V [Chromobacterium vaccinii]|nr:Phage baseplate assembly protein V [Chromobacterium vaccinii]QND89003.1 Phage baseplate assembly protein V [Chromobacterium vaccinii]
MSYELSELDRQMSNLIMPGSVCAVQLKPARVRVEADGWASDWVPWLALAAGKARHWRPPNVGEQAVLLNPSGDPAQGFALVGFYTDGFPGDGRPDVVGWLMPDGAVLEYDHAAGSLLVNGTKTVTLKNADTVDIQSGGAVTVKAPSIKLDTPEAEVTGNLKIGGGLSQGGGAGGGNASFAGSVKAAGDVVAGSISLQGHSHMEQGDGEKVSMPL